MVLSVAVLVLIISVMNGFERELKQRLLGVLPHISLYAREPLYDWQDMARRLHRNPEVLGASPFIQGSGLVAVPGRVAGVLFNGIDPVYLGATSDLTRYLVQGEISDLESQRFGILLGRQTAEDLGVGPGDTISVVLPEANVTPVGLFPRQKRFRVTGIFKTDSELDHRAAYIHIRDAAKLFRRGMARASGGNLGVQGVQVRVSDLFAAQEIARQLVNSVGPDKVYASTWIRLHGNLYRAIRLQKNTMFVLLSFLVGVAAFNLVSTLVMVVNERRADVAVLRTLGASTGSIVNTYMILGTLIGVAGVALGIFFGLGLSLVVQDGYQWLDRTFHLNLMNQYFVNYLPSEVRWSDVGLIASTAFGLCLLSTLYPAWRASKLEPAEILKHE